MIRDDECRKIIDIITTFLAKQGELTDRERLEIMAAKMVQYQSLAEIDPFTREEADYIQKNVEYNFSVTMERGRVLLDETYKPWYYERNSTIVPVFWNRYHSLLSKKLTPLVLGRLDLTTSEIIDYAGDPKAEGTFQRKGLIIGDVQSGKTNSYLGVVCKAIDAGYNVIIILAGGTDSLRTQTQDRVDEGIVGVSYSPEKGKKYVGVGNFGNNPRIISLTDHSTDFNSPQKGSSVNTTTPIILVIKKFHSILKNVYEWLKPLEDGLINKSLLLIDDEADYASINTSQNDITTTNSSIRSILSLFARSAYIGYTATPYANIFVNPYSYNEMVKEDLFPKDFIYNIHAPSNYIGPSSIFGENGSHRYMLKTIPNKETLFDGDLKHKKTAKFNEMPESLKEAISCFFIGCTLRDLNGDSTKPMSMMIHITRYIDVQASVFETVSEFIEMMRSDVISYSSFDMDVALEKETIFLINRVWRDEYKNLNWPHNTWKEIQSRMPESINKIEIKIVNSENEKNLDYVAHPSLRAIVVGGNSLTRGLTLEGLMISYFYRKSNQYDTLLQMGRWFGYRDGYSDLCRVWTHPDVQNWFGYVGQVNEELKDSIDEMCNLKKTPMQYGLRIQEDMTGFMMTSRDKMRDAGTEEIWKNPSGDVRNTMYVSIDKSSVLKNHQSLDDFYNILDDNGYVCVFESNSIIWKGIRSQMIIDLLEGLCIPMANLWYGFEELSLYISNNTEKWDVAIVGRSNKDGLGRMLNVHGMDLVIPDRKFTFKTSSFIEMPNRNLITPSDCALGLDYKPTHEKGSKAFSGRDYMSYRKNPLLLIYYINLKYDGCDEDKCEIVRSNLGDLPPVGFAFGFPADKDDSPKSKNRLIKYRANVIYQRMKESEIQESE